MKIYFACTGKDEPGYLIKNDMKNILCSFHYYKKNVDFIKTLMSLDTDVFIDSGGFSADTLGTPINIDDYCKFLKDTGATNYVVLDSIGDADKTYSNLEYMRSKGLAPFPAFHMGETVDWLEKYLQESDKLALGGMVGGSITDLQDWLDEVWRVILKIKPDLNVHGFGITSPKIMERYPWTSCDSSSFKSGKRFGRLIHYNHHKKTFYTENFNAWVDKYSIENNLPEILTDSKLRYEITDVYSASSYQKFIDIECSTERQYEHLTKQTNLFDF
jgi:hypothetical protein